MSAEIEAVYTAQDFKADEAAAREAARHIADASADAERESVRLSRLLYRMRYQGDPYWHGKSDREFIFWAIDDGLINERSRGYQLLNAGSVLASLEVSTRVDTQPLPLPETEKQLRPLTKLLKADDSAQVIADVWTQAVEDTRALAVQENRSPDVLPTGPEMAERVHANIRGRKAIADGADLSEGLDDSTEKVTKELGAIRRKLQRLYEAEPTIVATFVANLPADLWGGK